jgi:hypothetical protein
MSDWLVFITVVSPLVCSATNFPPEVMKLWAPLRRALLYFLRYSHGQHTAAQWNKARDDLLCYARLAEKEFGMHRLLTLQLHSAVVHLVDMVQAYGPAAFRMEFWVERMMQLLKRVTKYRTACSPELVAVNAWLLQRALWLLEAEHEGIQDLLRKIDPKAKAQMAPARDKHDEDGNTLTGTLNQKVEDIAEMVSRSDHLWLVRDAMKNLWACAMSNVSQSKHVCREVSCLPFLSACKTDD